jgi:hypothetical protein
MLRGGGAAAHLGTARSPTTIRAAVSLSVPIRAVFFCARGVPACGAVRRRRDEAVAAHLILLTPWVCCGILTGLSVSSDRLLGSEAPAPVLDAVSFSTSRPSAAHPLKALFNLQPSSPPPPPSLAVQGKLTRLDQELDAAGECRVPRAVLCSGLCRGDGRLDSSTCANERVWNAMGLEAAAGRSQQEVEEAAFGWLLRTGLSGCASAGRLSCVFTCLPGLLCCGRRRGACCHPHRPCLLTKALSGNRYTLLAAGR